MNIRMKSFFIIIFFLVVISEISCSRILIVQHAPSKSHYILLGKLAKELALRGHNVTIISLYGQDKPIENLREIKLPGLVQSDDDAKNNYQSTVSFIKLFFSHLIHSLTQRILEDENVQRLLTVEERFDLIILQKPIEEVFMGFSYYFKAPYIEFSTVGLSRFTADQIGYPDSPSYVPEILFGFSYNMNFWERVLNTLGTITFNSFEKFYRHPKFDELLQLYFPGAPTVAKLRENASLFLMNSHPSIGLAVPYAQNVIDIGGFHVEEPKPLQEDLQAFLDNATEGAIYFSMGSNFKGKFFSVEKREAILKTLSKLKQKVLWKYEETNLPNLPENIKISKWFPQTDILAHPNVILFITHGGLLSTTEAVHYGVPFVGIPVFADQHYNVDEAQKAEIALKVSFNDLTEESLSYNIKEILYNRRYKENMKERSRLFHDRPMKPMDTAVYWIEYVIRHRGAPHLKSVTESLKWYQLALLDVYAFLFVSSYFFMKTVTFFTRKLLSKCRKNSSKMKKKNE